MKFVTAQHDSPYFYWQNIMYIYSLLKLGVPQKDIHIIFGINTNDRQKNYFEELCEKLGVNLHYYHDNREKKHYIPSIKPYLIKCWLTEFPEIKTFLLTDSDIIFRELPDFDSFDNSTVYLSDTIGYIGYDYLQYVANNYKKEHPDLVDDQIVDLMCSVIGINKNVIINNKINSGGAQYLIQNTTPEVWDKIYKDSTNLYDALIAFDKQYPISGGQIQFWTAEMWSILWNLWLYEYDILITDKLSWCWATSSIDEYNSTNILHMAGVMDQQKSKLFYKGEFIDINPLVLLKQNPSHFDYIEPSSSTVKYVDLMREVNASSFFSEFIK